MYHLNSDPRRYNVPTNNEIAVVLPGENITDDSWEGSFRRVCEGDAADKATMIDYSKTGANKR